MKSWIGLLAAVPLFLGCSGRPLPGPSEDVATHSQAVTVIPASGFVPYPVLVDGTGAPVTDPDGNKIAGWDGSLAELLAADALGQCMFTSTFFDSQFSTLTRGLDEALFALRAKMIQSKCSLGEDDPANGFYPRLNPADQMEKWFAGRMHPGCNIDTTTGTAAVIPLPERDVSAYSSFTTGFKTAWTSLITGSNGGQAFNRMAQALSYGELNLCMSQRLQEQLSTASVVFGSDEDQLELLGFIRERSQLALLQYASLGKILSASGSVPSTVTNEHQFLMFFRQWAGQPSVNTAAAGQKSILEQIGDDYATAVRVHVSATHDFASLLRRLASSRPGLTEFGGRAGADWSDFTPRARLLNLLYGGDPLTTGEVPAPGRGFGGVLKDLPFVEADMRSPEVGRLLGLARAADLLLLKVVANAMTPESSIDIGASADHLYVELERHLRQQDCDIRGEDPCVPAQNLPSLPDYTEFELWKQHRVTPEHARALLDGLAQALGGLALGSLTSSASDDGYGHDAGMFHFRGAHETVQIGGSSWLHLDPEFSVLALRAAELSARFDAGHFLPVQVDLAANGYQQGFVTQRDVLIDGFTLNPEGAGGSWNDLRSLGAVPALAFVREAILQGSKVTTTVQTYFNGPELTLPLIDKAIGETSVALRPSMVAVDKTTCPEIGTKQIGSNNCRVLEQERTGNTVKYRVDVFTTTDDPLNKVRSGVYQREMETAARDAEFESFRGLSRTQLDALAETSTSSTTNYTIGTLARQQRTYTVTDDLTPGAGTTCNTYIQAMPNGDLRFFVTFAEPQAYVEVFSQKNGIQNVAQNIVSSQVNNPNGTYTYSLIRAKSGYPDGSQVIVRFYSYKTNSPGVFTPGPTSSVWSPVYIVGQDPCASLPVTEETTHQTITFLRGTVNGQTNYLTLNELPQRTYGGHYLSFGGTLNGIAERAWEVNPQNWSMPRFDAFDLPMDWVPPADASLVGGVSGEESYQYYLRSAEAAADEATAAVQTAIDTLVAESTDAVAQQNVDERARAIGEIEKRALCGESETCELAAEAWAPQLTNPCFALETTALEAALYCHMQFDHLQKILAQISLPSIVVQQVDSGAPDFSEFAGGDLQRILTAQWSAMRNLVAAADTALNAMVATAHDIDASTAALHAAEAEYTAALADIDAQMAANEAQVANIRAQITQIQDGLFFLEQEMKWQCCVDIPGGGSGCNEPARCGLVAGYCSGLSFDEPRTTRALDGGFGFDADDPTGWSDAGLITAYDRCRQLTQELEKTKLDAGPQLEALYAQAAAILGPSADAAIAAKDAAKAKYDAAIAAAAGATSEALSQFGTQLSLDQQAFGELLQVSMELDAAFARKEIAEARANLDADLAGREIEARFGLRRKFKSYDLWRARALLESARRLAVAARRAIEARFVVDLSEVDAAHAFVEAPSLWADEVYDSDLSAPATVGLSLTPTIEGAVFPNKLKDYVGNLRRFVQGYTVAYPTSVASPDTEVLSIPGPDLRVDVTVGEETVQHLAAESAGWRFFCPEQDEWLPHPGTGEYPLTSSVQTMCGGTAPTRALYMFTLDPWGRLRKDLANSPFTERHNVRWRRFAVNLVGTGIRDCQRADDPLACYSDSFVRFAFKHAGPAWVTNHAQQWQSYDIPTGQVEGGKALATEEWLDPIANSWTESFVSNVARGELFGRPVAGTYEVILELTSDLRLERLERIQILVETDYWVRQD